MPTLATPNFVGSCGGKDCEAYGAPALAVRVRLANGTEVCDADVVAKDGSDEFVLEHPGGANCTYYGVWERAGRYSVTATHDGETATSAGVKVASGDCHVKGKEVELILPR